MGKGRGFQRENKLMTSRPSLRIYHEKFQSSLTPEQTEKNLLYSVRFKLLPISYYFFVFLLHLRSRLSPGLHSFIDHLPQQANLWFPLTLGLVSLIIDNILDV